MIDIAMVVVTAALLALFAALLVMAAREDMREEARRRKQARMDVWVRYPTNPTERAYNAFLHEHNISTWPYEPPAGYDETREEVKP